MRIVATLSLSAATLAIGSANAAEIPASAIVWDTAPSFADMAAAWPTATNGGLQEGSATLSCRIRRDATIGNCQTLSDTPQGLGFAPAAKSLAGKFRIKVDLTTLRKDQDYFVTVPFRFLNPRTNAGRVNKVTSPRWISMPDPARIQGAFPKAAADAGVKKGVGVIDCATARDGRLTDCKVSREAPEGLGFGQAAMTVAPIMQMNPWTDDGRPIDGARIKLPIEFTLAGAS